MAIQTFNTPYEINLNTINGEPVSIAVHSERHIIYDSQIQLAQIPDEFYKVNITGKIERTITETLKNSSDFKVDYKHGVVYFHPSLEGKSITINSYYGKGIKLLYDDRVKVTDLKGSWKSTNLKDLLVEIKQYIDKHISNYDSHVSGESDKHKAPDIDYEGNVNNQTNVKGAIDNLQTQLNQVVNSGTESDARVSQALVDSEDTVYTTLKERNDAWEARTKKVEDEIYSSDYTPEIYNTSSIFTIGKGYAEAGSELDYSESVEDGQVNVALKGVTRENKSHLVNGNLSSASGNKTSTIIENDYFKTTNNTSGLTEFVDVVYVYAGKNITFSALGYAVNPFETLLRLRILNDAGVDLGQHTLNFANYTTPTKLFKTFTVPTGAIKVEIYPIASKNSTVYFKDVMLKEADELKPYMPSGVNSTVCALRLKSVGGNLFDGFNPTVMQKGSGGSILKESCNKITITKTTANSYWQYEVKAKHNTNYKISADILNPSIGYTIGIGDSKTILSGVSTTTTLNDGIIRVFFRGSAVSSAGSTTFNNIQLKEGTTATSYEPYKEDKTYISCTDINGNIEELRSLPNGVKDEVIDGVLHENTGKDILDGSLAWTGLRIENNNYRINLANFATDYNAILSTEFPQNFYARNDLSEFKYAASLTSESIANTLRVNTDGGLYLILDKQYIDINYTSNLAGCKNYLNAYPITLIYQLAEPKITKLPNISPLHIYKNGTIQFDNIIHQTSIYNDAEGCIAEHRDYPIKSIDFIKKVNKETGEETSLDVTKAEFVLEDSDKIGFTHPDLVDNDLVEWDYYYENESTNAEKVISYPINTKALIDCNAKSSTKNSNSIETLNNQVSNLMTGLNSQKLPSIEGQAGIIDMPVGAKYGGFNELNVKGQTLVNSVKNGDFSDGITGWSTFYSTINVINNIVELNANNIHGRIQQQIKSKTGDKIFRAAKVKSTSNLIQLGSTTTGFISHSGSGKFEIIGAVHVESCDNRYISIVDNRTSNWDKVYIDWAMVINMTQLGIEDYTEEQMLSLVRNGYFEGMQSVINPTFKTEGKNLFTLNDIVNFYNCNLINNNIVQTTADSANIIWKLQTFLNNNYIKTINQFSDNSIGIKSVTFTKDAAFNQITFGLQGTQRDTKITIDASNLKNGRQYTIQWNVSNVVQGKVTWNKIQLEEGTTATSYEPYQSSQASIKMADGTDCILNSLPNGVRDEIDVSKEKLYKRTSYGAKKPHLSTNWTSGGAPHTNSVRLVLANIAPGCIINAANTGYLIIGGVVFRPVSSTYSNDENSFHFSSRRIGGIYVRIEKTTFGGTTEQEAITWITSQTSSLLTYQLATPQTNDIQVNGSLSSFTGGRLLQWNGFSQAHKSDASGEITLNYPIKEIDEIFYFDNEGDKVIETNYILSSDGTSITGLNANTKYHIVGKAKNQIMAQIEGKVVGNRNTQIDSNTTSIKTTNEKLADMQDTVELLMLEV